MINSTDLQFWRVKSTGTLDYQMKSNSLDAFLPSLTSVQNRDLVSREYVLAIVNNHASLALTSARIYFRTLDTGGATLSIALDTLGPVVKTGNVWTPGSLPATFTTPTTIGTGLAVATLNPGFAIAVWVRRVATASPIKRPERNTLTITGTSAA